jgi:DNA-binding MarR family transcriptional regulator
MPLPDRVLISWRLIAFYDLAWRSATLDYCRATGLSADEWRTVRQVGVFQPLTLTELAALLAQDKAQASRAVKSLLQAGVLERDHPRGPITLSGRGRELYGRILRRAEARNAFLLARLDERETKRLPTLLSKLQGNARGLLAQARSDTLARSEASMRHIRLAAQITDREAIRQTQRDAPPDRRLMLPDFVNLLNLLRVSAGPAFWAIAPLSELERGVLAQVAARSSLTLIELVPLMRRDKSQVSRIVQRLEELELLETRKIGGGRHVLLLATERGQKIAAENMRLALERDAQLLKGFSGADREALVGILDKLTAGAEVLLERQRRVAAAARANG